MSIAKILVPLTGSERDRSALKTAFLAARPTSAHVVALSIQSDPRLAMPYTGTPLSPDVVQAVVDATIEVNRQSARAARTAMLESASACGVRCIDRPEKAETVTCSFREAEGFYPALVARAARLSDLVVFGPVTPADGPDLSEAFVETLMKTERPVLLAASAPRALYGHVMVAWDGSMSAAHAITGALPLLVQAGKITLASCARNGAHHFQEAQEYLALHGLVCDEKPIVMGGQGVGETLLAAAKESGADLLVMGGYGRGQLGEIVFGGVTQHIRWHADIPVLMVH